MLDKPFYFLHGKYKHILNAKEKKQFIAWINSTNINILFSFIILLLTSFSALDVSDVSARKSLADFPCFVYHTKGMRDKSQSSKYTKIQ